MNKIPSITKVLAKIVEVFHWVGVALMAAATVCSVAAPQLVRYFVGLDTAGRGWADMDVYGVNITAPCVDGMVDSTVFLIFGISGIIVLGLMAMVFRNLYLILKRSESSTPFQKDNVRMLREMGIFCISVPVVGLVMNIVARLVLGADAVETSLNMAGFFLGFVMLTLSQVFARGIELEQDVDGLV